MLARRGTTCVCRGWRAMASSCRLLCSSDSSTHLSVRSATTTPSSASDRLSQTNANSSAQEHISQTDADVASKSSDETAGSFAASFVKFEQYLASRDKPQPDTPAVPFLTLLRNSQFVRMGDVNGAIVEGRIFHVVNDDLYIDFGGKFHCVCPRPAKYGERYMCGTQVMLRLNELELSSLFLGASQDLTLLEAEATIIGIKWTPYRQHVRGSSPAASQQHHAPTISSSSELSAAVTT